MNCEHLPQLRLDARNIYTCDFETGAQADEIDLRQRAGVWRGNFLRKIGRHHSIPVMTAELRRFLDAIPVGGCVLDAGTGWGWPWREARRYRPDLTVYLVDFVYENLLIAKEILKEELNARCLLVHADVTALPFPDASFDGYWTVQTFQHIPDFGLATREAHRLLKRGGIFANYSFNTQLPIRLLYRAFGLPYHVQGHIPGKFYLARASREQFACVRDVFGAAETRFSEVIFKPELGVRLAGQQNSWLGKVDSELTRWTGGWSGWRLVARQQSYHARRS